MEWVASTLHTTSEHGVSSITTADAPTSAASSRLNWRPRLFKWTRPFRRKTKSGFCVCAITFQTQATQTDRQAGRLIWRNILRTRIKMFGSAFFGPMCVRIRTPVGLLRTWSHHKCEECLESMNRERRSSFQHGHSEQYRTYLRVRLPPSQRIPIRQSRMSSHFTNLCVHYIVGDTKRAEFWWGNLK
jgi:hypothetical protein